MHEFTNQTTLEIRIALGRSITYYSKRVLSDPLRENNFWNERANAVVNAYIEFDKATGASPELAISHASKLDARFPLDFEEV